MGAAAPDPGPPPRAVGLVVAHRGAWDPAPQNSLAAFRQALADGADGVELDVRRTADGRLVAVHDPRSGLRPIHRLTLDALRERLAPGQAPELDEVLAELAGRTLLDIEIKEDGYVAETMAVIDRHLGPGDYVVTSFRDAVLTQVRAARPRARTGLLLAAATRTRALERRVAAAGVDFLAPLAALAQAGLLEWSARRGLPAWVWTVNDPGTQRLLLGDPRVGAVITDRVADAVAAARALRATES